ncbi:hypothetical protein KAB08_00993 [Acinetobacter baumannii]|nr:hypothetical protein KAB08_00993 [Acinetobacter baumannii]
MLDLFTPIVESEKQHKIFKLLLNEAMYAEKGMFLLDLGNRICCSIVDYFL